MPITYLSGILRCHNPFPVYVRESHRVLGESM